MKVGIISITAEEYDRFLGLTAPDRRNDGRYVVVLDMFHQLHCVVSNLTPCFYRLLLIFNLESLARPGFQPPYSCCKWSGSRMGGTYG